MATSTEPTVNDLKILAYDAMAQVEYWQKRLQDINQMIGIRAQAEQKEREAAREAAKANVQKERESKEKKESKPKQETTKQSAKSPKRGT